MKDDPLAMAMLFDFYGDTLTDKQRDYFDRYYGGDLSLSEISASESVSRQSVRDVISRAETTLKDMETALGLVARYGGLPKTAERLRTAARAILASNAQRAGDPVIRRNAEDIIKTADSLGGGDDYGV